MANEPQTPPDQGPKGPQLDDMLDGLMGWNRSFLHTLKDGFIHPRRVAGAVLAQDNQGYASPIRLFVFLMGVYTTLSVFMLGDQATSMASFSQAPPEVVEAWLVEQGRDYETVNGAWEFWFNLLIWPITIVASSPYALLLKAFAPKRTLYGATLVYLTTINTMTAGQIILTLVLALFMDSATSVLLSLPVMLIVYFYITGRVIYAHYASSLTGMILKLLSIVLLTPITLIITVALQILLFDQMMEHQFGLNMVDIFNLTGEPAP